MKASTIFNGYIPECMTSAKCVKTPPLYTGRPPRHAGSLWHKNRQGWVDCPHRITPDISPRVDFARNWINYENRIGDLRTKFWYGLKSMHCLTNFLTKRELIASSHWTSNERMKVMTYDWFGTTCSNLVLNTLVVRNWWNDLSRQWCL